MKKSIIFSLVLATVISLLIYNYRQVIVFYGDKVKIEYKNIFIERDLDLILDTLYENENIYYGGVVPLFFVKTLLVFQGEKSLKEMEFFEEEIALLKKNGYKKSYKFYDVDKNMIKISFINSEVENEVFKDSITYLRKENYRGAEYSCSDYFKECQNIFLFKNMELLRTIPMQKYVKNNMLSSNNKIYINGEIIEIELVVNKDPLKYKKIRNVFTNILNQLNTMYKAYNF